MEEQHSCSSVSLEDKTQPPLMEESVTQKLRHLEICANEFPGSSATYRILEVTSLYCPGSGVSESVLCTEGGSREAEPQSNFWWWSWLDLPLLCWPGITCIFALLKCPVCRPAALVMTNKDRSPEVLPGNIIFCPKFVVSCYTCCLVESPRSEDSFCYFWYSYEMERLVRMMPAFQVWEISCLLSLDVW